MRKELFPVLLAAALVGSACQRPPETQGAPQKPQLAKPAETQKTPVPVFKERPKSPEEQILERAKTGSLHTWLQLLNSPQKVGTTSLQIEILNFALWQKYIQNIAATNSHPTEVPMEVKSIITSKVIHPWSGVAGLKYIGEIQINNLKVTGGMTQRRLTDADRANGIFELWEGGAGISFIRRYRAISYATGWNKQDEMITRWLSEPASDPLPPFSPWEEENWGILLTYKNGQWQRDSNKRRGGLTDGFELPSLVIGACYNTHCKEISDVKPQ